MADSEKRALLPAGLADLLPPDADREEALTRRLLDRFSSYGYRRVKPPLVEFEEGLLDGVGAGVAGQTFRVMDPVSHRMMGVRADITPQIARIAATRLAASPRPLRLSYSGEVLRVRGSQLRTERQFRQIGVELIGAARAATGDAEVILLAAEALSDIGVEGLSVDVNVPALAGTVCAAFAVPEAALAPLLAAVDRKDAAALSEVDGAGKAARALGLLLETAGPAERGTAALARLELPSQAAALVRRLGEVVELVRSAAPDLAVTIDPVESRGFEYHTGISFTLFALGMRGELGSGGRYVTASGEPATGFTLFTDMLRHAAPAAEAARRLFVPFEAPPGTARAMRATGWIAIQGLVPAEGGDAGEARRLGCSHLWREGAARAVDQTTEAR